MRTAGHQRPLSYYVRLPDEAQSDALRLLDASRAVVNAVLVELWPRLDEFISRPSIEYNRIVLKCYSCFE